MHPQGGLRLGLVDTRVDRAGRILNTAIRVARGHVPCRKDSDGERKTSIPFFDGHNDFLLRLRNAPEQREELWLGSPGISHLDLGRMKQAGFAGGLFAIYIPSPSQGLDFIGAMRHPPYEVPLPPLMTAEAAQPTALAMAGLFHWMERAAPDDFVICRSAAAVRAAIDGGRIAGVMHMEGAEPIGPDLDALYLFYDMGLRSLGPVWSRPTVFGSGVPFKYPGDPNIGPGLTDAGKDLVRICNELGVLIDLSHMNEAGFNDVAKLSTAPLVATHSNVHALCASPRNLTDRQLDQIRDTQEHGPGSISRPRSCAATASARRIPGSTTCCATSTTSSKSWARIMSGWAPISTAARCPTRSRT